MKKNYKMFIFYLLLVMIMTFSFNNNIFVTDSKEQKRFETYQKDSEDLVIGGIIRDKYNLNDSKYGLQSIKNIELSNYQKYNNILNEKQEIETVDYKSQVGIQGRIFSFLYNKLGISIQGLHIICSLSLAVVLTAICYLLKERYGRLFAGIFFVVFLLSPMIIQFARNLYWVEFTWFLPLLFCLLLEKTNNFKLYIPLIFLSVLLKCLCGYEYISTILLTAVAFFIVDFVVKKDERKQTFKKIFFVGIVSVLAFCCAICIHALIRGEGNVIDGIKTIIQEDVMRRTMGNNIEQFEDPLIQESIKASYISVIKKYYNPTTDIILGIEGKFFPLFSCFSFLIVLYNLITKKDDSVRDMVLYVILYLSTVSWFVLGKAHSYIHFVMNSVLWYFGYIQIMIYVLVKFIIETIRNEKRDKCKKEINND